MNRLLIIAILCTNFDRIRAIGPLKTFGVTPPVPKCEPSLTTTSGTHASKTAPICSGDLLFEDNFETFDLKKWQHENTLAGGGNWEFQWYTNNRSNSFCEEGVLHIRPTLLADTMGEWFLSHGQLSIDGGSPADECTNPSFWGCDRTGSTLNILNPIKSARLRSLKSFSFKYGKVEINAKMPSGDWLWPAIWLMPRDNVYGTWPASGEIDLVESRGNRDLAQNGVNIGTEQIGSTLHYGPFPGLNGYPTTHFTRNTATGSGWNNEFHRYQMEWTPDKITFSIDDVETGTVLATTGFWTRGGFENSHPGLDNPWRQGTPMAPFDQEFYLIMNLAVGGVAFFPDDATNADGKPWLNSSPTSSTDFWNARNKWLPTWNNLTHESSLLVDYVRVWAL